MCSLHLKCEYVAIMLGSPYLSSFLGSAVDGGIEDYDIRYENITIKLRLGMPASCATRWN